MLTPIRYPFHPVLPQWYVKEPGHSAKSAGGSLQLNMHTPLTQQSQSGLTMLSRHSVGTYRGSTDPGLETEIGVRELISTLY